MLARPAGDDFLKFEALFDLSMRATMPTVLATSGGDLIARN